MIEIGIKIKPVGLATVGGGILTVFGPDIPLMLKRGKPYIPGSTFKGALRSAASRIAEAYGYRACGEINPERLRQCGSCDVCRLFGSPRVSSGLFASDFEPIGETRTMVVTRVRIEDRTEKAEEGGLYKQEHVWKAEFGARIRIVGKLKENPRLLALLLLALAELRTGRIGRKTLLDVKLEDADDLLAKLENPMKEVAEELKKYLWEGRL